MILTWYNLRVYYRHAATIKISTYTVLPLLNGLSDHDAQMLTIKDLNSQVQDYYIYTARDINEYSINEFRTKISYETWDFVFSVSKITLMLTPYLNLS